jgi:hypothetical protein
MDKPPIVPRSPLNFDMSDDALELKFKQVSSHPMHVAAKIICLQKSGSARSATPAPNWAMKLPPGFRAPADGQHATYGLPNLLRHLAIDQSDHVWCAKVTYTPMRRGFIQSHFDSVEHKQPHTYRRLLRDGPE